MMCPNCGMNNHIGVQTCEFCGYPLPKETENFNMQPTIKANPKTIRIIVNVILVMFTGIWLLVGLFFALISGISIITENVKIIGYESTTAKLVDYDDCEIDDGSELCQGVYQFTVDGKTYKAAPNLITNKEAIPTTDKVYYDATNPEENVIKTNLWTQFIIGIVIIAIVITVFVTVNKSISKRFKNEQNNQ